MERSRRCGGAASRWDKARCSALDWPSAPGPCAGALSRVPVENGGLRLAVTVPRTAEGGEGMIRVLIAEDQGMVRGALASLLSLEHDIEVVAQVGRGDQVVPTALEARPDVALLDIEMPGATGLDASADLSSRLPECRVLILTTFWPSGVSSMRRWRSWPERCTWPESCRGGAGRRGGGLALSRIWDDMQLEVRLEGLEPPRACAHTDLNRARRPVPPQPRGTETN